jgi:hypothetical protein
MVIEATCERRICQANNVCYYTDIPLGLYMVRGDTMVLMGQVGKFLAQTMKKVDLSELLILIERHGTGELNWDVDMDLQA